MGSPEIPGSSMMQTWKREGWMEVNVEEMREGNEQGKTQHMGRQHRLVVRGRPSSVEIGSVVGPRNGNVREDLIRSSDRGQDHLTILRTP